MADISQLQKPSRKGEPPKPTETIDNLDKPADGRKVPFQLQVRFETIVDFKSYAAAHSTNFSVLFEKVWKYYKDHHG
jgi:hypothetical protein